MAKIYENTSDKTIQSGWVNKVPSGVNSVGVPDGQTPGFGKGTSEVSMNELPSNATVIKCTKSNLMAGMSQSRGPGGTK